MLKQYIGESMMPKGARIKKFPSTSYSNEFMVKWNDVLSKCSLDLMSLNCGTGGDHTLYS